MKKKKFTYCVEFSHLRSIWLNIIAAKRRKSINSLKIEQYNIASAVQQNKIEI